MASKAEERERRKQEKLARFEANKQASIAKVIQTDAPRVQVEVQVVDTPKRASHLLRIAATPKATKDGSRFAEQMTWCITKRDCVGAWTWGEPRAWEVGEWSNEIEPKLKEFGAQTWAELDKHASGSGHKMHHGHEISDLAHEAQNRWREIDLEQFDSVFRFRMGAKKRAWGYVVQAHFHMVWWERNHRIYPVATD